MPKNRLRELLALRGVSRSASAAAVGTSPFEIERIAWGEMVRFDMVFRLVSALTTTPGEMFPDAKSLFETLPNSMDARQLENELEKKEELEALTTTSAPPK